MCCVLEQDTLITAQYLFNPGNISTLTEKLLIVTLSIISLVALELQVLYTLIRPLI